VPSKYSLFDRSRLEVKPLNERDHDMDLGKLLELDRDEPEFEHPDLATVAGRLLEAKQRGATRLLMMGAHVIKQGVSRQIIDLVRRGYLTHIAFNGAGAIHDYELARIGATTESVPRYIRTGEFGLWRETAELNDIAREAVEQGRGFGEAVGKTILDGGPATFPHADVSILAAAYQADVPVTVHVGIGYDIIHEHPNCDGGALGAASYTDFLIYTQAIENLEGGVMLNFGSAIMGPEVYLKALAMSRNVARQEGRSIAKFATAVFDLVPIRGDYHRELPKDDPGYYFRPHKTILVRTVADGGESFYLRGDHRAAMSALRRELLRQDEDE